MRLKTKVGQIFLEHPKDENYVSMYEETFRKQNQSVQLFGVMEISGLNDSQLRGKKTEYENLTRTMVAAFKKTFVASPMLDEDAFERALGAVNAALGKLGAKGKVEWLGRLNASLAAFTNNELYLSTTGNAVVYLARSGSLTLLSEGLAEDSKPIKIFSNFASGKLSVSDRLILSTKQLFNYLSFDKIREEINTEDLEDACHEIITALSDLKNIGFATFICQIVPLESQSGEKTFVPAAAPRPGNMKKRLTAVGMAAIILKTIFEMIAASVKFVFELVSQIMRKKTPASRKKITFAAVVVLLLLISSIGFSVWKKTTSEKLQNEQGNLARAEEIINEAEAAAIYQDDARVLSLAADAEKLLSEITNREAKERLAALRERIKILKDKINKEIFVENPVKLADFVMIPTDMVRSSNGFLAFNRHTGVLAFYDFRSGEAKEVLASKNTSGFVLGGHVGGTHGYVFFQKNGKFAKVDIPSDTSAEYPAESPNLAEADKAKIQDLAVLGEGNLARIYLLDTLQSQIWRFRVTDDTSIGSAERWLKSEAALSDALDIAIDNNIYVLFSGRLDRYFNGDKQNFALSQVAPPIQNATRIFTDTGQLKIYVLEPSAERILIYDKTGRLQTQLKSAKFRDASDLSVDERNKFIYVISGQELLQVNY